MSNIALFLGLTPGLTEKVKELEKKLGSSIYITSGLRSKEYNASLNGSAEDSQHLYGRAVDIARNSFKQSPEEFKTIALLCGFTGIGFYDKHVHVDIRPNPHPRGYSFWDNRTGKGKYDQEKEKDYTVKVPPGANEKEIAKILILAGLSLLGLKLATD